MSPFAGRIIAVDIELTPHEARIIGALIEKEITTPDQYPLSLNAITSACNQKSNREPVMALEGADIQWTLDLLIKKNLISVSSGFGSRVMKYRHRFCNTEFGPLAFSPQELGIICVLLLRGPQTPGELRTRTSRLCQFSDVREVESTLTALVERDDGPFVTRLQREPGKREARYGHLFSGEVVQPDTHATAETDRGPSSSARDRQDRLERLEQAVMELRQELDELKSRID